MIESCPFMIGFNGAADLRGARRNFTHPKGLPWPNAALPSAACAGRTLDPSAQAQRQVRSSSQNSRSKRGIVPFLHGGRPTGALHQYTDLSFEKRSKAWLVSFTSRSRLM